MSTVTYVRGYERRRKPRPIEADPIWIERHVEREISKALRTFPLNVWRSERKRVEPLASPQFDKDGEAFKQRVREAF